MLIFESTRRRNVKAALACMLDRRKTQPLVSASILPSVRPEPIHFTSEHGPQCCQEESNSKCFVSTSRTQRSFQFWKTSSLSKGDRSLVGGVVDRWPVGSDMEICVAVRRECYELCRRTKPHPSARSAIETSTSCKADNRCCSFAVSYEHTRIRRQYFDDAAPCGQLVMQLRDDPTLCAAQCCLTLDIQPKRKGSITYS